MDSLPDIAKQLIALAIILCCALAAMVLARKVLVRGVILAVKRTKSQWDDALLDSGFFYALCELVPVLVIHLGSPFLAPIQPQLLEEYYYISIHCAFIAVGIRIVMRFLDALYMIYGQFEGLKSKPIKGYFQLIKIFMTIAGGILIVAAITRQSPLYFLSGLGAITAVLLLVFKDTLLSLVASVQISTQRLVQVGDWIEVPAFGADGDVIDVALHTITVQNWDKTLSIIPTCEFLQKGFKNWRGMTNSGGRRIKRSLNIDLHSIRYMENHELEKLSQLRLLTPYLNLKKNDIHQWQSAQGIHPEDAYNNRRLTNIGCFRAYLKEYLAQHPHVISDGSMTLLVRQLQPSELGIPLEIYVFCSDTRWIPYEEIQADIFDHILATMPLFDLKPFQVISGRDIENGAQAYLLSNTEKRRET